MNDPRIITIETCTANASSAVESIKAAAPAKQQKRNIVDRIVDFMLKHKAASLQRQLQFMKEKLHAIPATADAFKHSAQVDYGVRLEEINKWRDQSAAHYRHKIAVLKAEIEKSEAAK